MISSRRIFRSLILAPRKAAQILRNPYYWGFFVFKKLIWIGIALFSLAQPADAFNYEDYPVVKLRSLDKITARTMTFEAKVGSTVRFGEIFIKVQSCRKPPPIEKPESAAFLQIWQNNAAKETSKWIFSGWMFASSPALSPMDHPVYDVWVLDCLGRDPEPVPVQENSDQIAPDTDGEAPDAVMPAVEPDTAAAAQREEVSPEDDPGAYETPPAYSPTQDEPATYQDNTAPDAAAPNPAGEEVIAPDDVSGDPVQTETGGAEVYESLPDPVPAPAETAPPVPAAAPPPAEEQQFQGIY